MQEGARYAAIGLAVTVWCWVRARAANGPLLLPDELGGAAAEGVHDPLFAKALVFEEGGTRSAIVVCDLSGVPLPTVEAARRLIENTSGIRADHLMISATHTHTGPVILRPGARYNLDGEMLRIAREYVDQLPSKIAESVSKALASL